MGSSTGSKINQLLRRWPNGTVAVSPWLEKQGASQQLFQKYEATAWVRPLGQGAYAKAGDKVEWTGGLYAIQAQMDLAIHAGGKTALQIQGYAHFLPIGRNATISLLGNPGVKLRAWFKQDRWGAKVRYTATNLFADQGSAEQGLTKKRAGGVFDAKSPRPSAP